MDKVFIAISDYLTQKNIPANLVLKIEAPVSPESMERLGFRQENEMWVIGKNDAQEALKARLGIKDPPDWNAHWQDEQNRPLGRQ